MSSRLRRLTAVVAAGAGALAYATYRRDIEAATKRVQSARQVIDSPNGPIEFAESGEGPAVLVIHGAGGGFDQGLDIGRGLFGQSYRIVAPSRFGYLGTPVPADASPEAQADAHARLLDALHIESVPVVGVSAGGPSALQFCLRHKQRCSSLVLLVPLAYSPRPSTQERRLPPYVAAVLNALLASDFLFWSAMKVARPALIQAILGTPADVARNGTAEERENLDRVLRDILPISRRFAGIHNDTFVATTLAPCPLETLRVPTLVISVEDDLYATYDSSRYTAAQIPGAKFVGFARGGHLMVGHEAEVRSLVTDFVKRHVRKDEPAIF